MNKKEYQILCEAYGLNKSRLPNDGRDPEYGIPEQQKYPLWSKAHTEAAINYIKYADPQYRKELAKRIISKMKEYGISPDTINDDNPLKKYLNEGFDIKPDVKETIKVKDIVGMNKSNEVDKKDQMTVPEQNLKEEVNNKLTLVLCNLREDLRGELDAILNYDKRADVAEENGYPEIAKTLRSIRDEEKVHCGELEALIKKYDSNAAEKIAEGEKEQSEELDESDLAFIDFLYENIEIEADAELNEGKYTTGGRRDPHIYAYKKSRVANIPATIALNTAGLACLSFAGVGAFGTVYSSKKSQEKLNVLNNIINSSPSLKAKVERLDSLLQTPRKERTKEIKQEINDVFKSYKNEISAEYKKYEDAHKAEMKAKKEADKAKKQENVLNGTGHGKLITEGRNWRQEWEEDNEQYCYYDKEHNQHLVFHSQEELDAYKEKLAKEKETSDKEIKESYRLFVKAVKSMNLSEDEKKTFKKHLLEFKKIQSTWNNKTLTESELDPINKTRCADIFDANEKMHPEVKKYILEVLNKFKKECPYKFKAGRIILIGSSTGFQYTLTSDIDINFETTLTDEQRNEVYPLIPHNVLLPGTNRPINVFCVTNGEQFNPKDAENMYDIVHDTWLKKSDKNEAVLPYQYIKDLSRFFIDGAELALSRYRQNKQELEIYMALDINKHDISQKEKADKVAQKLVDLKNDVDALHLIHHIIYAFRGEGFNGQLFKVNIEMANQDNPRYSPNNLVYKMIDRFGYLEKLHDACTEGGELVKKVEEDAGEDADANTKA